MSSEKETVIFGPSYTFLPQQLVHTYVMDNYICHEHSQIYLKKGGQQDIVT